MNCFVHNIKTNLVDCKCISIYFLKQDTSIDTGVKNSCIIKYTFLFTRGLLHSCNSLMEVYLVDCSFIYMHLTRVFHPCVNHHLCTYVVKNKLCILKGHMCRLPERCSGCLHADGKHLDLRLFNRGGGGGEITEINKGIQLLMPASF